MSEKVARIEDLQQGDWISVTDGNLNVEHDIIKLFTNSDVSHNMIYIGANRVIEAVGGGGYGSQKKKRGGVITNTLAGALTFPWAAAYRARDVTAEDRQAIVAYAFSMLNQGYDTCAAIGSSPIFFWLDGGEFCFCSEFVVEAYRRVGKPITNLPRGKSYPGSLSKCGTRTARVQSLGWLKNPKPEIRERCDPRLYGSDIPVKDKLQQFVTGSGI